MKSYIVKIKEGLNIRSYKDCDWCKVCDIHDRARPIELKGSCDANAFTPLSEDKGDIDDFNKSEKYVALENNEIVGFVGINGDVISWLYVDPNHFGRGIGRELLVVALRGIEKEVSLFVVAGNLRAISLYESLGFELKSTFKSKISGYPSTCQKYILSL